MEAEAIRVLLEDAFPGAAELDVEDRTGMGDHFQVTVTSAEFDGLSLLDQHRRVNAALAAPLGDGSIHELRIKTKGTT
jgi:stress-induced morphogen